MKNLQARFEQLAEIEWMDYGEIGNWRHVAAAMFAAGQLADPAIDLTLISDAHLLNRIAWDHDASGHQVREAG